MKTIIITGVLGLVGSSIAKQLKIKNYRVIGIDNDYRSNFFSDISALNFDQKQEQEKNLGIDICHNVDIANRDKLLHIMKNVSNNYGIYAVIHCAAQPSHDWAAKDPFLDFDINASGTLNICEGVRRYSPKAILIHLSTNKVYGDTPNFLPLEELNNRFELRKDHIFYDGINESMNIDNSKHSLFGCSKLAADIYVQEYARYFGIKTIVLRGGCLTGENHRGAKLHGFMNYLIKCAIVGQQYEIIGYKGKQVRDNLYSGDIADLIIKIFEKDKECTLSYPIVANIGGGRKNSTSILELISKLKLDFGLDLKFKLNNKPREGDHIWYISDNSTLNTIFGWEPKTSIDSIIKMTIEKQVMSN